MDHQQDAYHYDELLKQLQNLDFGLVDSGDHRAFVVHSSPELPQFRQRRIEVRESRADWRDQLRIAQT
jgi:hypothetical protein